MAMAMTKRDDLRNIIEKTLFNPSILTHILKYVPDEDLANCRLVASNWHELALDQMKNYYSEFIIPIILTSDNCLRRFTDTFGEKTEHVFYSLFVFENSSDENFTWSFIIDFFKTFRHQISKLVLKFLLAPLQFQELLELHGSQLTALEIDFEGCFNGISDEYSAEKVENIMKTGTIFLPNLEFLLLTNNGLVTDEFPLYFLKTILSFIPRSNLLYMSLYNWPDIAMTMTHLVEHGQVKSLRDLSTDYVGNDDFDALVEADDLQLDRLHFRILDDDTQFDRILVQKFFTAQRSTLKNLCWASCVCPFPTTGMTQLEDLTLWFYHFNDTACTPIFYEEMLPNLIKLRLGGMFYDQMTHRAQLERLILPNQTPCFSVRKVHILDAFLTGPSTLRMSEIFPNICSLKIRTHEHHGSYEEIFRAIWNSQTFACSLEKLELDIQYLGIGCHRDVQIPTQPMRLDQVFSGASESEIEQFNRGPGRGFKKSHFDQPKYNSILKLKKLKRLYLFTSKVQSFPLTDFSGYCIFTQMPKLTDLFIHENLHNFSQKCLKQLPVPAFNVEYIMKKRGVSSF